MSGFIKETFITPLLVQLCFGGSLTIKCVSLNYQQFTVRQILIDLNVDEFCYYTFIVSINKCNGSSNTVEDPFD